MLVILKLPSNTRILDRGLYFIFGTLINIEFECVPFFSQCACCKAIPCRPQEQHRVSGLVSSSLLISHHKSFFGEDQY